MVTIPAIFSNKQKNKKYFCPCEQIEDVKHIYNWNREEATTELDEIFGDDIDEQIKVNKRFQYNLEEKVAKSHVILSVNPLSSLFENRIGNK